MYLVGILLVPEFLVKSVGFLSAICQVYQIGLVQDPIHITYDCAINDQFFYPY